MRKSSLLSNKVVIIELVPDLHRRNVIKQFSNHEPRSIQSNFPSSLLLKSRLKTSTLSSQVDFELHLAFPSSLCFISLLFSTYHQNQVEVALYIRSSLSSLSFSFSFVCYFSPSRNLSHKLTSSPKKRLLFLSKPCSCFLCSLLFLTTSSSCLHLTRVSLDDLFLVSVLVVSPLTLKVIYSSPL